MTQPQPPNVLSITEVTFAIKSLLEANFRSLRVRGEISNLKLQSSGHLYFSLKDAGAQLSAVLFKGSVEKLARMPKEGDQVIAVGELNVYAPRGGYQLVARELQFLGVGELLLQLHQRKELLEARGWFDARRKKPLPKLPKRIGVVTSPTGAVIQDILHVLTRRFRGFQVMLNPVKVQGEGAALEIAQAIDAFNQYELADVLIVGRGGGSIEDLWAFNEEIVAKAIFESRIPVISAVGHETDFTIADLVADVRAPTPSAAAEIAIAEKGALLKFLGQTAAYLQQRMGQQIEGKRQKLFALQRHPLIASPHSLLLPAMQRLGDMQADIDNGLKQKLLQYKQNCNALAKQLALLGPTQRIAEWRARLALYPERLTAAARQLVRQKRERFQGLADHLQSLHPNKLLRQGYAILFNTTDVIRSVKNVTPKQTIRALLSDGEFEATVETVKHDPRTSSL